MLANITYFPIFGKPMIMYLGLLVLTSFIVTGFVGRSVHHGNMDFKWHMFMIKISFTLAGIHAVLGVLAFF